MANQNATATALTPREIQVFESAYVLSPCTIAELASHGDLIYEDVSQVVSSYPEYFEYAGTRRDVLLNEGGRTFVRQGIHSQTPPVEVSRADLTRALCVVEAELDALNRDKNIDLSRLIDRIAHASNFLQIACNNAKVLGSDFRLSRLDAAKKNLNKWLQSFDLDGSAGTFISRAILQKKIAQTLRIYQASLLTLDECFIEMKRHLERPNPSFVAPATPNISSFGEAKAGSREPSRSGAYWEAAEVDRALAGFRAAG